MLKSQLSAVMHTAMLRTTVKTVPKGEKCAIYGAESKTSNTTHLLLAVMYEEVEERKIPGYHILFIKNITEF